LGATNILQGAIMPKKRAAAIIGINKTGGLVPLQSPAENAEQLGLWLAQQPGFSAVKVFTDKNGPVTPQQIAAFVNLIVDDQTYDQLLIYFSGHGLWKNRNEFWLLSGAPQNADAAISLEESASLAKDCGIPSVILISDACRSLPKTKQQESIRGSVIFPNEEVQRQSRPKIDRFLAAVETDPAYEIQIDGKMESVFTYCLRQAYRKPDADMVRRITEDGIEIAVVPNTKLETYLRRQIAEVLANANLKLEQTPDVAVLSSDDVYIARVEHDSAAAAPRQLPASSKDESEGLPSLRFDFKVAVDNLVPEDLPRSIERTSRGRGGRRGPKKHTRALPQRPRTRNNAPVHISDVADVAVTQALDLAPSATPAELKEIHRLSKASGFDEALKERGLFPDVERFESRTGFTVTGAAIDTVRCTGGGHIDVVDDGSQGRAATLRYWPASGRPTKPETVVLQFKDGRGTALAALPGYIAHSRVEVAGLTSVSYVPSANGHRWDEYKEKRTQIERLRAAAAAAAQFGVFRIADKRSAERLASGIRMQKALDPSLGLYAAYAYFDGGRDDEVNSVMDLMQMDISGRLFDVAMLARRLKRNESSWPVAPFCPMLTQGWNLLRSCGAKLPEVLDEAQDQLMPSLWTTFKPKRIELILEAIESGTL
jgi:hypothetical protein